MSLFTLISYLPKIKTINGQLPNKFVFTILFNISKALQVIRVAEHSISKDFGKFCSYGNLRGDYADNEVPCKSCERSQV